MSLWGGRFSEPTDNDLKALNDSIGFDIRMAMQDIRGSIAYSKAIEKAGVITEEEGRLIRDGLARVQEEFEADTFELKPEDEDIHTAVERRLTEHIGATGGKLHTGRSRNDQVATDFRLWTMDAIQSLDQLLLQSQVALIQQAEQHIKTVMPGFTHMQPAQPITVAHWMMSFFWMLARDRERLQQAYDRVAVSPLGSGALAGNPFPIDRQLIADELGFNSYSQNSLDGVSDRDFVAETLFVLALVGTHLSKLAEDIIIYSNPLFGFITLDDRYSTGSSLMPQKRNADPMELARGKAGRLIGHLTTILTVLKGLPSGYNKDLQEDKESLFDAFNTMQKLIPVVVGVIRTLKLNADKMRAALAEELLATDMADYLVKKGLPFREAHHVIGSVVRHAADNKIQLSQIPISDLREISEFFEEDVAMVFDFDAAVARKSIPGSTAPQAVSQQLENAKRLIGIVAT